MRIALTRGVGPKLADCELMYLPREKIDLERARIQHSRYAAALAASGCQVVALREEPAFPDAVFVEDVAVVLDELAVLARPGAESRRGEVAGVAQALAGYRQLRSIQEPGTLEGGDVLRVGSTLYVGLSQRTNTSGVEQLEQLLAGLGYTVSPIEVHGCLHLKSAVTQIDDGALLINPEWVDPADFPSCELTEVDRHEPFAANALRVGHRLIFPSSFPRTRAKLEALGHAVTSIDVSELQKAEAGVTCCSLIFDSGARD